MVVKVDLRESSEERSGHSLHPSISFSMIPLGSLGLLPLLSLYVGALLSSNATLACTYPPCTDSLVAAPMQPGSGAGAATRTCEIQPGTSTCRTGVALRAVSDVPRKVEHRRNFPQVQPRVSILTNALLISIIYGILFVLAQSRPLLKALLFSDACSQEPECNFLSATRPRRSDLEGQWGTLNLAPPDIHRAKTASNRRR